MSEPFFSVIVPAHHAAEYIRKGLQSILTQAFTDYELIVVADDCNDDTALIALDYADKCLVRRHGLDGLARNDGLDVAAGKWVLFMDDDDWWMDRTCFGRIAEAVTATDPDVLLFGFYWNTRGVYFQTMKHRYIAVWNKCWRREFIGETRFSSKPYWSDVDFDKAMFDKYPKVSTLDKPLYYYNYLRPGSISWRKEKGEIV